MATPPGLDLERLLALDPILSAQFKGIGAGVGSQLAGLDEATRRALIGYGGVPEGYETDPVTRGLAADATTGGLSSLAQLADLYRRNQSASRGSVAARGIARSGAFGQHALRNLSDYSIAQAGALNKLMETIYGYRQQGLTAQQTGLGQQTTAVQSALDRYNEQVKAGLIANPGATTPGTKKAAAPLPNVKPGISTGGRTSDPFQVVPGRGRAPLGPPSLPQYGGLASPFKLAPGRGRLPY
jgi:hypothetical protein